VSDVALQTLRAVLVAAPYFDETDTATCAALLAEVQPRWWQPEWCANVAARIGEHLFAGRRFGLQTLKADVQGDWVKLERASEIESIRVGVDALKRDGQRRDFTETLKASHRVLDAEGAAPAAAFITSRLAEQLAGGMGFTSVASQPSVIELREQRLERPNSVIRVHPRIDEFLRWGGLPRGETDGETVLLCARSSHGKTATALAFALSVASQGERVNYNVIADASAYQIYERLVYAVAGIPRHSRRELDKGVPASGIRPQETLRARLAWAESVVRALPIHINAQPNLNQHTLRVRLHHTKTQGATMSVWDNLDHMKWDQSEGRLERREQLGELTQIIRQFDRDTGHHSVILAQANRQSLLNADKVPTVDNVQDSDQVKNHLTFFLGIYNPNVDSQEFGGQAALAGRITKNRDAPTGPLELPVNIVNPAAGELVI
jgi:DnaB-like helicase C terminal domain